MCCQRDYRPGYRKRLHVIGNEEADGVAWVVEIVDIQTTESVHTDKHTHTQTHTHTHTHTKWTNGQMLSPPRLSTSTLRSVAEIAPLASRDRVSMCYVESWGQRYNLPGAWPESSKDTDNEAALGLDTKAHTYPSVA